LLLLLVRDSDPWASKILADIVRDLETLKAENAYSSFKPKLRMKERFDFGAGRTELAIAAWLRRRGYKITLEPNSTGTRVCEFLAATEPPTWWEIKAVRDTRFVEESDRIQEAISWRLRRIPEPYVLTYGIGSPWDSGYLEGKPAISIEDVPRAVKQIKAAIREHHAKGGTIPASFEAFGLSVEAVSLTKRGHGYVGANQGPLLVFSGENAERARARILDAAKQLPPAEAGVVVIDTSGSDWADEEDIKDACFGTTVGRILNGKLTDCHGGDGVFQKGTSTRVSVVVRYTRNESGPGEEFRMTAFHNPFAAVPLPLDVLEGSGVKQIVLEPLGGGFVRFIEHGTFAPE